MKVSRFNALKSVCTILAKKVGIVGQEMSLMSALQTEFNAHISKAKFLRSDNFLDLDIIQEELFNFFNVVPMLRMPFDEKILVFTSDDARELLKELKKYIETEDVIYLSYTK